MIDIGKHILFQFQAQYKNKLNDSRIHQYKNRDIMLLSNEEKKMLKNYVNEILDYHTLNGDEFIYCHKCTKLLPKEEGCNLKKDKFYNDELTLCKDCFSYEVILIITQNVPIEFNAIYDYDSDSVLLIKTNELHSVISFAFKNYNIDISDRIVFTHDKVYCECQKCETETFVLYDIEDMIKIDGKFIHNICYKESEVIK